MPRALVIVRTNAERKDASELFGHAHEALEIHARRETALCTRDHALGDGGRVRKTLLAHVRPDPRTAQVPTDSHQRGARLKLATAGHVVNEIWRWRQIDVTRPLDGECLVAARNQFGAISNDPLVSVEIGARVAAHWAY